MTYRILLLLALLAAPALGQTTQPAAPATRPAMTGLEVAALAAFNRGDYKAALPLLIKLSQETSYADRRGAIQEQIRVCQKNLLQDTPRDDQARMIDRPRITPEQRKPHIRPANGAVLELALQDLGNFEYDAEGGGQIPEDVRKLSGAKFRTRGFMIPIDQADKITEFYLVSDLFNCCIGQPPQIHHTITIKCPKGKAVGYFPDEIVVEGILKVEEKKDDQLVVSVFEVEATSVQPAAK